MTRRTGILLVALLATIVAASLWLRETPTSAPQDVTASVTAAIESALGQDVSVSFDFQQSEGTWAFSCGSVSNPDGTAITAPELALESPDFCALLDISTKPKVVELDIGSTDMPAMDWLENYDLPRTLFSE